MNKLNLGVALTKCFYCLEDNMIIMNRRLTKSLAEKVEAAHGKVIDMTPCSKCQEFMRQSIILITIDDAKSDKNWSKQSIPNPYRTGGWFVVRDKVVKDIAPPELADWVIRNRFMFIAHEAAEMLGLFEQEDAT